ARHVACAWGGGMNVRIFNGETPVDAVPADDRGLAYGDGLFETMRVHAGSVPLWSRHYERLHRGAQRLTLPMPRMSIVEAQIDELIHGCDAGVLKLLATRGAGGRGYAPASDPTPTWLLALHPLPAVPTHGLRLHWCETRLAVQPRLAGIKHCNRLEQVLARAECGQAGCDEGLMCSTQSEVVCATAANLLVLRDGVWLTPPVEACGVAGVCRGWLLEQGLVEVAALTPRQVESAQSLALCNAVRGILPVAALADCEWPAHAAVAELQAHLAEAFTMFQLTQEIA
ncbi:MAG: aminodeoxychorismate lyase, partial [Thermomonas sp.]